MSKNGGFYSILNITKRTGKIDFFKEKCQKFTFFYIVVFGGRDNRCFFDKEGRKGSGFACSRLIGLRWYNESSFLLKLKNEGFL